MPARCASPTSQAPGSDSAGVPASLTSAIVFPSRSAAISPAAARRSLCACRATVRALIPWRASSVRVVRVSSQAMRSALRRVSRARGLVSERLPIGVATTYRTPGVNRFTSAAVKRAMNAEGARAEDLCADLLRGAGLLLIERNWRCRLGEIDLIAEDRGMLVFAEVRMRTGPGFGGAGESVTAAKRARLLAAARLYLSRRPETLCRFDVFLVDGVTARVQWIRDAFGE